MIQINVNYGNVIKFSDLFEKIIYRRIILYTIVRVKNLDSYMKEWREEIKTCYYTSRLIKTN